MSLFSHPIQAACAGQGEKETHQHSINIPHKNDTFVTADGPTLKHVDHPKFIVCLMVYLQSGSFCGFGKLCYDMCPSLGVIQSNFTALKALYPNHIHPNRLYTRWPQLIFFTLSTVSPFSDFHVVGIIQHAAFSDWLLSLGQMHCRFLHVFSFISKAEYFIIMNAP